MLCNAEVVESSRNEKAREGCMSVPDLTGDVKRASRVVVRGQLPGSGAEVTVAAEAFEARALQHEIDHCQGLLFVDRVAGAHAVHPRKTYSYTSRDSRPRPGIPIGRGSRLKSGSVWVRPPPGAPRRMRNLLESGPGRNSGSATLVHPVCGHYSGRTR